MQSKESASSPAAGRFALAHDLPALLRRLGDNYYTRGHFAFWAAANGVTGITVWGHLTEEDAQGLRQVIEAVLATNPEERWPNRASLVDASEVVGVDPRAFEIMAAHFADQRLTKGRPARQAMIRPRGYTGSVVAGFFSVARAPFETAVFTSVAEALAWAGKPDSALAADLDQLRETLTQASSELKALHGILSADVAGITLTTAARRLGVSSRTLQRRLQDSGTTFHEQRSAAQVRAAKVALVQTEDKIAAIARSVGCASASQFSALFRRQTGESPREFRDRSRGATSQSKGD